MSFYKNKHTIKRCKAVSTPGATIGHFDNQTQGLATLFTRELSSTVIVIQWSLLQSTALSVVFVTEHGPVCCVCYRARPCVLCLLQSTACVLCLLQSTALCVVFLHNIVRVKSLQIVHVALYSISF
jgi:hypothetical protein